MWAEQFLYREATGIFFDADFFLADWFEGEDWFQTSFEFIWHFVTHD